MKFRFGATLIVLLTSLVSHAAPQTGTQAKDKDLPNFHKVNQHLYRGAQPTLEGVRKLARLGIKTIINLRGEGELSAAEAKVASDVGMTYRNVPMPDFSRPKDEQVETVLGIINDPQYWPVFVHCKHGEDRTGVIIACYRISKEDKTDKEALKEAKKLGMSRFQFGMKDYIGDYYKRKIRLAPALVSKGLKSFPCSPPIQFA